MKKRAIVSIICAIACVALVLPCKYKAQAKKTLSLSADSAIVMDVQSGAILYEKNMDQKQYPASITKVMTALLAIENSSMSEIVTYSDTAVLNLESGASNIGLQVGEQLNMEDSLYAVLLASANEACNGVGEHIAGSIENYVDMMNKRAKELGCTGTHFANTNGLWMKNHYTTAHDMALIAREAYKNPEFAKITGTKYYVIKKTNKTKEKRYLANHHGMLVPGNYPQYVYEYCVGGKTGYTSKCRYTLVTYAKKDGMTLVSVVMRADAPWETENEYSDSTKLLNYCFENYSKNTIKDDAASVINSQYLFTKFSPFYTSTSSSLFIDEDAAVLLPKGVKLDKAEKTVNFYDTPYMDENGKKVIGKIVYTYNKQEVGGSDIYYQDKGTPTLKDSINMSEWFDDAVEEASKEPFPWKKVAIIVTLILVVGVTGFYIFQGMRSERERRARRNRYKRSRRNMRRMRKNDRGMYYRRRR